MRGGSGGRGAAPAAQLRKQSGARGHHQQGDEAATHNGRYGADECGEEAGFEGAEFIR